MALSPLDIVRALALGDHVDDVDFDSYLPAEHRRVSGRFWTPVSIAATAGRWLAAAGAKRVLDVGSGAGKLCVVAALSTVDLHLTGIEQRGALVAAASGLAARFGVRRRAEFVAGTMEEVELTDFDALYLFNPFAENVFRHEERLDDSVELTGERMRRDLAVVEDALERLSVGRGLVTYHGFGGKVPDTFDLERAAPMGTDVLRFWIKRRATRRGQHWMEIGEDAVRCSDVVAKRRRGV